MNDTPDPFGQLAWQLKGDIWLTQFMYGALATTG